LIFSHLLYINEILFVKVFIYPMYNTKRARKTDYKLKQIILYLQISIEDHLLGLFLIFLLGKGHLFF
jgi:hypothetical protein